jgi:hypothetical protein
MVRVAVKVPFGPIKSEFGTVAPPGTLVNVTKWPTTSSLVQVTVLFAPTTTVGVSGLYPVDDWSVQDPFRIEIASPFAGGAPDDVVLTELEDDDVWAPPPDPATTTIVPTIVLG